MSKIDSTLIIKKLGLQDYEKTWQEMKSFTDNRTENTPDELWLLEHHPVFTQGQAGKAEHVLNPGNIPIIQTDRGGQVTYHGPGQLVAYPLMDLRRKDQNVRSLVCNLEQVVLNTLTQFSIHGHRKENAPGIYVDNAKICSLGIRIRRGYSYHGIALNVNMDLLPFQRINPCGYQGLQITQIKNINDACDLNTVMEALIVNYQDVFSYQP